MPAGRSALLVACALLAVLPGHARTRPVAPAVARPTYLILIDVDSLDAGDARKARILTGAFVDGLDPDDRVAILSVSSSPGTVEATTNRLAARAALEAIVAHGASQGASMSLAEAIAVVTGDTRVIERLQKEAMEGRAAGLAPFSLRAKAVAWGVISPTNRLVGATTQLLGRTRDTSGRLTVVWLTNHLCSGGADADSGIAPLIEAAVAAHTPISIVIPTDEAWATAYDGYRSLATATGGTVIRGIGSIDTAAQALLKATAGPEARRADPAGISELTSLRRCAERSAKGSAYLGLVEQYRTGDADAAVAALRSWTPLQLASDVVPLPSLSALEAAVALHTEAGIRSGLQAHLDIARRAVGALKSRQMGSELCRLWTLVTAAYSRVTARSIDLADLGGDPAVVVALGSLLEVPTSLETQPGLDRVDPPVADLSRAADLYRNALAIDPGLAEARLRLGRVLGIQHHTGEAIAHLERARLETKDPRLFYLASLFLGEIHEATRDSKAATTAYRAAIQSRPDALAARVALARLLQASGRFNEAGQVLHEKLSAHPVQPPAPDPWQEYFRGWPEDVARELSALRRAVRK